MLNVLGMLWLDTGEEKSLAGKTREAVAHYIGRYAPSESIFRVHVNADQFAEQYDLLSKELAGKLVLMSSKQIVFRYDDDRFIEIEPHKDVPINHVWVGVAQCL